MVLKTRSTGLTDDQFIRLCSDNRDLRIEMSAEEELIIMSPAFSETGRKNAEIILQLGLWTKRDGTGVFFESSAGFTLPNGAKRAPDASWIRKDRWDALATAEKQSFAPICPDFVVELRSTSDALADVKQKMDEYIANGARLGWLLDPIENRAYIYQPGQPVLEIEKPEIIDGDPVLPGFRFKFVDIL